MTYRTAFLGCGPRAREHAAAYQGITRGEIVAICDLDAARRDAFGEQFSVARRYADAAEMLERERPHLLHIVTAPALRVPLMTLAAEHNVPAALVEKPLALDGGDYLAIRALGERTRTRFVVNHQLRFHPKIREFQADLQADRIGALRYLDASARLFLAGQGTHVIDLMFALNGDVRPTTVFGQVAGAAGLSGSHPAPEMACATITFANGVRGALEVGKNARRNNPEGEHFHKRIAAYGTQGFVEWQMEQWERSAPATGYEQAAHRYREEDRLGQRALTEAVFDWLDDETRVHPNNLDTSLAESNLVLGLYASALRRTPVSLPFAVEEDLLPRLRAALAHDKLTAD
jgi:predicted dehydrogenase